MDQRKLFVILGIGLIIISILQITMSIKIAKILAILILIIGLVFLLGRKGIEQVWKGARRSTDEIKFMVGKKKTTKKEENKNICKKCGSKLKSNAKFCDECGEKQ